MDIVLRIKWLDNNKYTEEKKFSKKFLNFIISITS